MVISGRPEGFFIIPIVGAFAAFSWKDTEVRNRYLVVCVALTVALSALVAWRYFSFGLLFPLPVYAKTNLSWTSIRHGVSYITDFASRPWATFATLLFGLCLLHAIKVTFQSARLGSVTQVGALLTIAYLAFIVFAGGDWMGYGRFVAHILPVICFAGAVAVDRLIPGRPTFLLVLFAALFFIWWPSPYRETGNKSLRNHDWRTFSDAEKIMMLNIAHRRDLLNLLPYIRDGFVKDLERYSDKPPVVLSGQAGFFPYFARMEHPDRNYYFLDSTGLTEPGMALVKSTRCRVGIQYHHDFVGILSGNYGAYSEYILNRRPAIIYLLSASRPGTRLEYCAPHFNMIYDREFLPSMNTLEYHLQYFSCFDKVRGATVLVRRNSDAHRESESAPGITRTGFR